MENGTKKVFSFIIQKNSGKKRGAPRNKSFLSETKTKTWAIWVLYSLKPLNIHKPQGFEARTPLRISDSDHKKNGSARSR